MMERFSVLAFSFFLFFFCLFSECVANNYLGFTDTILTNDSLFVNVTPVLFDKGVELYIINNDSCQSVPITLRKTRENKKVIAAILAFPFPFGILGLHRIYLGTKPYMPFAYIGTLGGCFGILPLIDFISILTADDETFKRFENNPKVFMWSH